MSSAEVLSVLIDIRTDISKAVSGLSKVRDITKKTTSTMNGLQQAGMQAAGMLMRDMVNGAQRAVQEIIGLAGKAETLRTSFERLRETSDGYVATLEEFRRATMNTVSDVDLLTSANQALMLGLPTEGLEELFGAAIKLGSAMGIDAAFAVDSLTKGIGRQSKMILDNLGIVFKAEDAFEWYAKQLGVTSQALSENQRRLGWQQFAIKMVTDKAEELGDVMSDAQKSQQQFGAAIDNLKTSVAGLLAPLGGLLPIFSGLMPMIGTMAGVLLPKLITSFIATASAEGVMATMSLVASSAISILTLAISTLALPLLLIAGAVLLFKTAWENNWLGIRDIFQAVADAIMGGIQWIIDGITALVKPITNFFDWIGKAWNDLTGKTETEMNSQVEAIQGAMEAEIVAVEEGLQAQLQSIESHYDEVEEAMAEAQQKEYDALVEHWMNELEPAAAEGMEAVIGAYSDYYDMLINDATKALNDELRLYEEQQNEAEQMYREAYDEELRATNQFYDELLGVTWSGLENIRNARSEDLDSLELHHLLAKKALEDAAQEGLITDEQYQEQLNELNKGYRDERGRISDEYRIQELQAEKEHKENMAQVEQERVNELEGIQTYHENWAIDRERDFQGEIEGLRRTHASNIEEIENGRVQKLEEIRNSEAELNEQHNLAITQRELEETQKREQAVLNAEIEKARITAEGLVEQQQIMEAGQARIKASQDSWLGEMNSSFSSGWENIIGTADQAGSILNSSMYNIEQTWAAGLSRMEGNTEDFYNDMVGGSVWTDLMEDMVGETERGLGRIESDFTGLETITPQVARIGRPAMSSAMAGGIMGLTMTVNVHVEKMASERDEMELVNKVKQSIAEELISQGIIG